MYHAVFILPNSGDDWETNSPFSTLLGSGKTGFCFANQIASALADYTLIESKLLDTSDIDQSVDIFSGAGKTVEGGIDIKGIGGVASSGDFSFTLEKTGVDPLRLLGRSVKVTLDLVNANIRDIGYSDVHTVFTGTVRKIKPGRNSINVVCSGLLATLKEKEVGTVSNNNSDIYKSEITPIMYGDQTDANAFSSLILSDKIQNVPNLIIDSQPLSSISKAVVYNEGEKKSIDITQELNLSANNNTIYLEYDSGIVLKSSVTNSSTSIEVVDPFKVSFELTTTPTLTVGDVYRTEDGLVDNAYVFIEVKDGYYVFTCFGSGYIHANQSGTLYKVSGAGGSPATLLFTFVSGAIDPILNLEQVGQSNLEIGVPSAGSTTLPPNEVFKAKPNPLVIKIDDEFMLVHNWEFFRDGSYTEYAYTRLDVQRGYYGTTAVSHSSSAVIKTTSATTHNYWKTRIRLWPCDVSNFYAQYDSGKIQLSPGSDIERLTYKYRTDSYSSQYVQFETTDNTLGYLNKSFFFIDLVFPKLGLKGNIVNAFVLGEYDIGATNIVNSADLSSISIVCGGQDVGRGGMFQNVGYSPSSPPLEWTCFGAGAGRFVKYPTISELFKMSLLYTDSLNRIHTLSAISFLLPNLNDSLRFDNVGEITSINFDEDSYSLRNAVEYIGGRYYRDTPLGDISAFNDLRISLRLHYRSTQVPTGERVYFKIGNPGLLLDLEINPIEQEIFIRGIGRGALKKPQLILMDILDKELSFTDVTDNVSIGRDTWSLAFTINKLSKFTTIAQSICEQGGLILSDNADGTLNINSITPPEDTSGLTIISSSDILEIDNMLAIEEEWTSIDNLITDIIMSYQYNFAGDYYPLTTQTANIPGISSYLADADKILDVDQKATIELPYIRDITTVNNLALLVCRYNTSPLRILTVQCAFTMSTLSVGQWVICNVASTGKIYFVIGTTLNLLSGMTVKLLEMPDESVLYDSSTSDTVYVDTSDSTNVLIGG